MMETTGEAPAQAWPGHFASAVSEELRPSVLASGELLEDLVSRNLPWLTGWVKGRVKDPELVHDICQDSFLKALRGVPRLKDLSKFSPWLYRIARNTLRDHLRRSIRRKRKLQFAGDLDAIPGPLPTSADPSDAEEAERLLEKVRALPSRYREPLLLRHSENLTYAEIGKILRISENAVQVRIFRARRMLRGQQVEAESR
jgi:RNA polymerase sigma-70 factor (ECF subfamily)